MTDRSHLRVLPGGKQLSEAHVPNFTSCAATNTRLMGVVGICAIELTPTGGEAAHFFHLDFEEYGIDAYERLDQPRSEEVAHLTAKMMGGLGGELKVLRSEEMAWLLREAYRLNLENRQELPPGMERLFHFLKAESQLDNAGIHSLWLTLTPELMTDAELINYYLMRGCAGDQAAMNFLSRSGLPPVEAFGNRAMLVRNRIQALRESGGVRYYQVEALSDTDREYFVLAAEIGVFEEAGVRRVFSVSHQSRFRITEVEASFMLRRKEYLAVYKVRDVERVQRYFDTTRPDALVNLHEGGILYTTFKPHNEHVRSEEYYLNNDVQTFVYLSDDEQLILCSLERVLLEQAITALDIPELRPVIRLETRYEAPVPILYDFVQSDYLDFHEFWEDFGDR